MRAVKLGFIKALNKNVLYSFTYFYSIFSGTSIFYTLWRNGVTLTSASQLFAEWFHVQYWPIHYRANFTSPCTNLRWKSAIKTYLILSLDEIFHTKPFQIHMLTTIQLALIVAHRVKLHTFKQKGKRQNIILDK